MTEETLLRLPPYLEWLKWSFSLDFTQVASEVVAKPASDDCWPLSLAALPALFRWVVAIYTYMVVASKS